MKLNVITGLPRSGSTLLCNILNQNPKFHATSTSELPRFLSAITHQWTNSIDVKNELNQDREKTEDKMARTMRAYVEAWHKCNKEVIFDKSRGWSNNALMLRKLYPDSKMIVCVRDLRNVFASVEKQHQKNPLLDEANELGEKTIISRAEQMFSGKGLIGHCIIGIEDMLRRNIDAFYLKFEDLTDKPDETIKALYEYLGEEAFEHSFKNIVNTAKDPDGFYLWKYPHKGDGDIKKLNKDEYKDFLSPDLCSNIINTFGHFMEHFNYIQENSNGRRTPNNNNQGRFRGQGKRNVGKLAPVQGALE